MGDEVELPSAYSLTPANGDPELPHSWGFTGSATAKYTNGDVFVGDYVDGKKQGKGTYTHVNGDVFVGEYTDDKRTGVGMMTYASGGCYNGNFENGVRSGEGTFVYPTKDIYSGLWKAGKKSGEGFYVFANSKYYYQGTWKNGEIVTGKWVLSPSRYFEGSFTRQKPSGDGKFVCSGYEVHGCYSQEVKPLDSGVGEAGKPPMEVANTWETYAMTAIEA
ncbi:unnamed protein product [Amoebophrya sp. A120]|nr:unnamed protein product [Amoebophrya sp. A120]|eukprot:GSA120T00011807001.1